MNDIPVYPNVAVEGLSSPAQGILPEAGRYTLVPTEQWERLQEELIAASAARDGLELQLQDAQHWAATFRTALAASNEYAQDLSTRAEHWKTQADYGAKFIAEWAERCLFWQRRAFLWKRAAKHHRHWDGIYRDLCRSWRERYERIAFGNVFSRVWFALRGA